ncbi:MAG: hypothetical protein HY282_00325 [Nitrospirae bacterium]|nr:hypothetical protein [Candidatus Manganitrophaceae bacterium]
MKIHRTTSIYLNPLLLIVWFFIWGICPWSNATPMAQAAGEHAHPGADRSHHSSKGAEHSCSGSISYSKSDLGSDRLLDSVEPIEPALILAGCPAGSNRLPYFFELTSLPRLLNAYYQLYSVYRI